ncbi:hypothetical protein FRC01_004011 [Tulasnella sp. 417]|nr:hypothetical protein FRC01_004011 [Tulasnella sp. 417]
MSSSGSSRRASTSRATADVLDTTIAATQISSGSIVDTPLAQAELLEELSQTYNLSDISLDKRFRLVQLWKAANRAKEIENGRFQDSRLSEHQRTRLSLITQIKEEWGPADHENRNPYDDLRNYTQTARLEPLPWRYNPGPQQRRKRGKSRTQTAITDVTMRTAQSQQTAPNPATMSKGTTTTRTPEKPRDLGSIHFISMDEFGKRVRRFSNHHIPKFGVDSTGQRVKADCDDEGEVLQAVSHQYRTHAPVLTAPKSEDCVKTWISQIVLPTAARILHVSDPNTAAWAFSKVAGKGTQQILSDLAWERQPSPDSDDVTLRRLVVEVKSPSTMPLSVLRKFVDLNKLPTLAELQNMQRGGRSKEKEKFSEEEKVWAQLYDYCHGQGHHYFILTTYDHWVFGVFSLNFTSAQVSDVIPYSHTEPTVLECITYWVQSSMFVPGCFEIPMFGSNDSGPPAPLEPPAWERAWSIWRSHGFEELDCAIARALIKQSSLGANQTQGKKQEYNPDIADQLPREEEDHFRRFLIDSGKLLDDEIIPGVATFGKKILNYLLEMPWIPFCSWVFRLTWLALVQKPRYLGGSAYQLEAAFVDAVSGVWLHPIHATTVTEHVVRRATVGARRVQVDLPKFLPRQLHPATDELPSGAQQTKDLEKSYQILLTKEITWVLLHFLDPSSVSQVKRALSIGGYASFDVPPFPSMSAPNDIEGGGARISATIASPWSRPSTPGLSMTPDSLDGRPLHRAESPELLDPPNEPVEMQTESSSSIFGAHGAQEPLLFDSYHAGRPDARVPIETEAFGGNSKVQPKPFRSMAGAMELDHPELPSSSRNNSKTGNSSGCGPAKAPKRKNSATSSTGEIVTEPAVTGSQPLAPRRVSKRLKGQVPSGDETSGQ